MSPWWCHFILFVLWPEHSLEQYSGPKDKKMGVIGQKLRYDRCSSLSFFVRRLEDEIFDLTDDPIYVYDQNLATMHIKHCNHLGGSHSEPNNL